MSLTNPLPGIQGPVTGQCFINSHCILLMSLKGHYIIKVSYALGQVSVDVETQGHLESSQGFSLDEKTMLVGCKCSLSIY